ncbi:PTS transporter subunit IIC [Exiguobacterium oxidotolerans]|uniref:Regulator n=1 Tax=Exiguobacterium oxidotolerans TaxID=223958 RepID=A0A653IGX5_9BACL|nr:PTS sugar transporter subunit IIC [Exiguobacterium oxidotolerans]VWX38064.1 Regulator [Exiguobacterium oxidotolerans]
MLLCTKALHKECIPIESSTTRINRQFGIHVLNGLSIGILVALIPGALLGELAKALLPYFAPAQHIIDSTTIAMRLLPMVIGVAVAMQFKTTPIETASIGLATVVGSGVATRTETAGFLFVGTGDVINAGVTAAIATALVLWIGNRFKTYTVLVMPTLIIVGAGGIGVLTYPFVTKITAAIGQMITQFTVLQPILMGVLLAVTFSVLIVSPLSTVGIATAISLSGIAAGAANLGVCAAGFGLAIAGWKANSRGTSIAHFLGSPKIQMANFIRNPIMIVPVMCSAAVLGGLAGILGIQGTPFSAGFGMSGLIGPINALHLMAGGWTWANGVLVFGLFILLPIVLCLSFHQLFRRFRPWTNQEDYRLDFE